MSDPFPLRPSITHTPRSRRVCTLCEEDSAATLEALRSETARTILEALAVRPTTPSELADRVDTTVQNVQYHLERLHAADLVTTVGTWYSAKGREMDVYAPTFERLEVRLTADAESSPRLDAVTRSHATADDD